MTASAPWLPWAGAALLVLACGALLDTPWVRARVARRGRARLLRLYARARDRRTLEPLAPFLGPLEEAGAALAVGAAVSALLVLVFGMEGGAGGGSPLRLWVVAPFYLGLFLVVLSLLRLVLRAPRAFLLWVLWLVLGGMEWGARRVLGETATAERLPFTYAAVLAVLAAGAAVAGALAG